VSSATDGWWLDVCVTRPSRRVCADVAKISFRVGWRVRSNKCNVPTALRCDTRRFLHAHARRRLCVWVVRHSALSVCRRLSVRMVRIHVTVDKVWSDARVVRISRDGRVVRITCALLCGKLQRVLLALARNNEAHAR